MQGSLQSLAATARAPEPGPRLVEVIRPADHNGPIAAELTAATVNAFASLMICYFWARSRLGGYQLESEVPLSSIPTWKDFDDATVGIAFCTAAIIAVSGFVIAGGLGFTSRHLSRTALLLIPLYLWLLSTIVCFATLSEEYLP
jgi:hypothetical protein